MWVISRCIPQSKRLVMRVHSSRQQQLLSTSGLPDHVNIEISKLHTLQLQRFIPYGNWFILTTTYARCILSMLTILWVLCLSVTISPPLPPSLSLSFSLSSSFWLSLALSLALSLSLSLSLSPWNNFNPIPTWINNNIARKMSNEITYPFPNFND